MYSNKENVGILTSLLVACGVRHAVVCPGSRNAPIVHNLNECPAISCHAVTDERSAGFHALGIAQALDEPVAVCVTSGSALLNLMPAVAEAHYQHVPLVVISADRPPQCIGQLEGQTLQQPGALGGMVKVAVTLPEPRDDEERWYCNRLVNEALLALPGCVHINVPISEPLFTFDKAELPQERLIRRFAPSVDYDCLPPGLFDGLLRAERPMIVVGQTSPHALTGQGVDYLFSHVIVLHESLAPFPSVSHFDEVLSLSGHTAGDQCLPPPPDLVLHVGDAIVSKRLKTYLRQMAPDAQVWRITQTGQVEDTFRHLRGIIEGDAEFVFQSLNEKLNKQRRLAGMAYRRQWLHWLSAAKNHCESYEPPYSQMAAVREFEQQLWQQWHEAPGNYDAVHYANSSAIRLANIYASHHVWCNRGVNGIEGSLSAAAGFSTVADCPPLGSSQSRVFCVIGDLSFFYDQNALWNQHLRGNLRILLLNNGCGGIFGNLHGLESSPAAHTLVAAAHDTAAEGICRQCRVDYLSATNMTEMRTGLQWLVRKDNNGRPMLLEVFTSAADDVKALQDYYLRFSEKQLAILGQRP